MVKHCENVLLSLLILIIFLSKICKSSTTGNILSDFALFSKRNSSENDHVSLEIIDQSGLEFCDNTENIGASREDCKYGFQFGANIPECICFKGLYRMILDDCFESDGLSEGQICTRPFDTQRESGAKIFTVQMTQEVNWDHTHVVCEKEEKQAQKIWSVTTLRGNGKPVSVTLPGEEPDFYTINGVPYILDIVGNKQAICVLQKYVSSFKQEKICRYFKNDNDHWRTEKGIEITIRNDSCGDLAKQMIPSECFPSVRDESSECSLPCAKPEVAEERSSGFSNVVDSSLKFDNAVAPLVDEDAIAARHDNLYLDRKMMQYMLASNLKDNISPEPLLPNKTFELFKRMITLTTKFCPEKFVPSGWVEYAASLFMVIHKGNTFAYEETITDANFDWSRTILDKCIETATSKPINLSPNTRGDTLANQCTGDTATAWGYCPEGNCNILNVKEMKPHDSKSKAKLESKHYVPELAWNLIDISQAICFRDFNSSYRMFHIVQQALEHLFTDQIKNLWYFPTYNNPGSTVKPHLLGEVSDEIMRNLEICTTSAYDIVNTAHLKKLGGKATPISRLKRPMREPLLRKKRSTKLLKSISSNIEAYCLTRAKDWRYPESCFKNNNNN